MEIAVDTMKKRTKIMTSQQSDEAKSPSLTCYCPLFELGATSCPFASHTKEANLFPYYWHGFKSLFFLIFMGFFYDINNVLNENILFCYNYYESKKLKCQEKKYKEKIIRIKKTKK